MEESSGNPNKVLVGIVVVVLLAIAATAVIVWTGSQDSDPDQTTTTAPTSRDVTPSQAATKGSNGDLKDGTYMATGSYQTPGGLESIGVRVTLSDGIIRAADITKQGKTGEAQMYQGQFASSYKDEVVGKEIDEVSITRVAGSSLTSIGFKNALEDIERQAQS